VNFSADVHYKGKYALAVAHLAPKSEVLGTVLIVPATPPDASRAGQSLVRYLREMQILIFPGFVARGIIREHDKLRQEMPWVYETAAIPFLRKTEKGQDILLLIEKWKNPKGYVLDYRNSDRNWGFRLSDVDANHILMYAGGRDTDTPLTGIQYMRNRLQNCKLQVYLEESHKSLQQKYTSEIMDTLKRM
jgi:hypothetical protein